MGAEAGQGIEWSALLDPASLVLTLLGLAIVTASAYRSLIFERETEKRGEVSSENFVTIDTAQALGIPILSSCILLLVFYFFSFISMALVVLMALCAASALAFALTPVVNGFCRWAGSTTLPSAASKQRPGTSAAEVEAHVPRASMSSNALLDPLLCGLSFAQMVLGLLSSAVVILWLVSGHWVLNDILGAALCVTFSSYVRLPNLKVCTVLLLCLFTYDIFWVFLSEHFFGQNVMVSVATQQSVNPVHTVAKRLRLDVPEVVQTELELPVKLIIPHALFTSEALENARERQFLILGLGDLALPSLLLAFALCHDNRKLKAQNSSLTDAARQVGNMRLPRF